MIKSAGNKSTTVHTQTLEGIRFPPNQSETNGWNTRYTVKSVQTVLSPEFTMITGVLSRWSSKARTTVQHNHK